MKLSTLGLLAALGLCLVAAGPAADFDGDGTPDVAVFRDGSWMARNVTRVYLGTAGDQPVPGDYDGDLRDEPAIFRPASGLWSIRGLSRLYFGATGDLPRTGDYDGDGTEDVAVFRPSNGLWAAPGITRFYLGASGDQPLSPGKTASFRGEVPVSGQTIYYQVGDDGYHRAGSEFCFQTFVSAGALLVRDRNTGLVWAADGNAAGCFNGQTAFWNTAVDWCYNLDFGGYTDWRLPNIKELQSIVHYGEMYPAIDEAFFPNTKDERYWSSTTWSSGITTSAFTIDLRSGAFAGGVKAGEHCYLRAVRGP